MGGIETNKPTKIDGYDLTASAAFSLRSIVGTHNAAIKMARPILARANDIRKAKNVRFITETHIVTADAELFHEKLEGKSRPNFQSTQARPGGARSGRGPGAPVDGA